MKRPCRDFKADVRREDVGRSLKSVLLSFFKNSHNNDVCRKRSVAGNK